MLTGEPGLCMVCVAMAGAGPPGDGARVAWGDGLAGLSVDAAHPLGLTASGGDIQGEVLPVPCSLGHRRLAEAEWPAQGPGRSGVVLHTGLLDGGLSLRGSRPHGSVLAAVSTPAPLHPAWPQQVPRVGSTREAGVPTCPGVSAWQPRATRRKPSSAGAGPAHAPQPRGFTSEAEAMSG